ncbi:MAG: hypothetical protein ABI855_13465, partial [Bacteroidota bacterium]
MKIMRRCLLIVYLFLSNSLLFAQLPDDVQHQLKKATSDTARIRLLLELSDASEDISVMTYANKALDIINKNLPAAEGELKKTYLDYKAFALNNIGYGYRTFTADIQKAIIYYKEALAIYEQTGKGDGLTDCISNLQNVYIA